MIQKEFSVVAVVVFCAKIGSAVASVVSSFFSCEGVAPMLSVLFFVWANVGSITFPQVRN